MKAGCEPVSETILAFEVLAHGRCKDTVPDADA
jgi:hypothetical protein